MSVRPRSFHFLPARAAVLSICGLLMSAPACTAAGTGQSQTPGEAVDAPQWSGEALVGAARVSLAKGEAEARAPLSLGQKLARLDLMLDLFDAARFGPDAQCASALWSALDLEGSPHGDAATRQALRALLAYAMEIEEEGSEGLDDDTSDFLSSAIMLLNVDVNLPVDAEQLEIQLLAHRRLREHGHERLRDNAMWRLYDHARDALDAARSADAETRVPIGLHALLVKHETLLPWLKDGGPHEIALRPTAAKLIAITNSAIAPLAMDPRWSTLVERRQNADRALLKDFEAHWPAAPSGDLPLLATGYGRKMSDLPLLRLDASGMQWDASEPHPFGFDDAKATQQLMAFTESDGRLGLYLDPISALPAPDLASALRVVAKAGVQLLELGLRESRHAPSGSQASTEVSLSPEVWTQLPLRVLRGADHGPETQAFRDARAEMELGGRGVWLWVDDERLNAEPLSGPALRDALGEFRRAYPDEAALRLYLHSDVQYEQLLEAVGAVLGPVDAAPGQNFRALAWVADAPPPQHEGSSPIRGAAALAARLALADVEWQLEIEQPFPMRPQDQARAEGMAKAAQACWPELALGKQDRRKLAAIELTVNMHEGGVIEHDFAFRFRGKTRGPKLDKAAEARTHECLKQHTQRFRLPSHRDRFELLFRYRTGS